MGKGLLAGFVAVACALASPAAATALPDDPPFEPLMPADGATLPVSPDGIPVSYTCPVYRIADPGFPLFGGPKDYGVSVSTFPELGADGRLGGTRNTGAADLAAGADRCAAALGAGGSPPRLQETPGTYYWQVYRLCTGCTDGYEVGPVRSFTLRSPVTAELAVPAKAYDGYPFFVSVALAGAPAGTQVVVERKAGASWLKVATTSATAGKAEAVVTLAHGDAQLRAAVTIGAQAILSAPRHVNVKRARNWSTSARSDGRYAGSGSGLRSVALRIAAKGRELRDFDAKVPLLCPGVTAGRFTTQIGTAKLRKVKIAPDGRFAGTATPGRDTAIRVRGRLAGRKVSDARVELSVGNCSGSQAFSARRAGG